MSGLAASSASQLTTRTRRRAGGDGARRFDFDDDRDRDRDRDRCAVPGPRPPVGIAVDFDEAPLDSFLEIVPFDLVIDHVADTGFDVDGAIGIRCWF